MILWLGVIGIAVAGVVAVLKVTSVLGQSRDPARRALWLAIVTVGLAMTGHLPPVYQTINDVAGFNLSWPIQRLTIMISAYCSQLFFLYAVNQDNPDRVRRRVHVRQLVTVTACVAVIIPFLLRPDAVDFVFGPTGRYEAGGPGDSIAQLAQVAFTMYMIWAELTLLLVARCWAGRSDWAPLRIGLRVLSIGYGLSTLMVAHSLGYHLALLTGAIPPWPEAVPTEWLIPFTSGAQLGGVLVPTLWPQLVRLRLWIRHRRALTALYPLWSAMVSALPEVALDPVPGPWRDRLRVLELDYLLYRRVIEIWDVRSRLRQYLPADLAEDASRPTKQSELDNRHPSTTVEAATIGIGLRALRDGRPTTTYAAITPTRHQADLAAEVAWWRQVATAFRRAPLTATSENATQSDESGPTPGRQTR